ncbi:MAG: translation elongation factor Ts [Flavobacteriaceae bacterium]|nr:translation elongation factor Ts [Flavobacteriaceae bacterium]MCY4267177.1 translation elongation factor Ts [Flavobacteriaceae bacterium]MCY4298562.1 translation elongation factor Ts [Flavobacteriaceae bacterium]
MSQITAKQVGALRSITGAGMMDCKKALVEAQGDKEKAIEILRKKGQKVASKRSDRTSSQGFLLASVNDSQTEGILFSLNCETDFVAKNQEFQDLAKQLAPIALKKDKEDLLATVIDHQTVADKLSQLTGNTGEKIEIGAYLKLQAPYVGHYVHNGNQMGALVGLDQVIDAAAELSQNIAMQVVAMKPLALDQSGIDPKIIAQEREVAKELLIKEGKPEHLLDNIIKGKLQKFYKENTLLNQLSIIEEKLTVKNYIKSIDSSVSVTKFQLYSLG